MFLKVTYMMCLLGFHKYKIINIDFSFGQSLKIIKVQCKNCGLIKIKKGD